MARRGGRRIGIITLAGFALLWAGCAEEPTAPPPAPSGTQFSTGQTLPGYVLTKPTGSRADVTATGTWSASGGWTVLFKRELKPRPSDTYFSLAITENGHNHMGDNLLKLSFDPAAVPDANTVVSRRIANDGISLDGVIDGNDEWETGYFSTVSGIPWNNYPLNEFPEIVAQDMIVGSAYDDEYIYFIVRWQDQGGGSFTGTQSDMRNLWQHNGGTAGDITDWTKRPHAGNDTSGNGILDGNEILWYGGTESEDRIFFMFPITDVGGNFRAGGTGCALFCHANLDQDPIGGAATMSTNFANELGDIWHWKAARTAPAGFADDKKIVYDANQGNGRKSDAGTSAYSELKTALTWNHTAPTTDIHTPLISASINYTEWTVAGYSEPANMVANATNAAPVGPVQFTGNDPTDNTTANSFVPYAYMRQAAGSRGDVQTKSTYSGGWWTVEFRRLRLSRDISGGAGQTLTNPIVAHADDHQFESDADFARDAAAVTTAANGLPFSVAIFDNSHANEAGKAKYIGPFLLSADTSLAGATSPTDLYIHDYGTGWTPTGLANFNDALGNVLDPPFTTTGWQGAGTGTGTDRNLLLRAGTDGTHLYILATWDDTTQNDTRNRWTYDGSSWIQAANPADDNEDRLAISFNISGDFNSDPWNFGGGGLETGCASFCHDTDNDGEGDVMRTEKVGQLVDVWHWKATRTNPIGYSDDQVVDWTTDEPDGDSGRNAYSNNKSPDGTTPLFMGPNDPGESPKFLYVGVAGQEDRVLIDFGTGVAGGPVSFAFDIQSILNANCVSCHGASGGLNLASYGNLMAGGDSGFLVVPGSASSSLLVKRIEGTVAPQMPSGLPPLSASEVQAIRDWIDQGALDN